MPTHTQKKQITNNLKKQNRENNRLFARLRTVPLTSPWHRLLDSMFQRRSNKHVSLPGHKSVNAGTHAGFAPTTSSLKNLNRGFCTPLGCIPKPLPRMPRPLSQSESWDRGNCNGNGTNLTNRLAAIMRNFGSECVQNAQQEQNCDNSRWTLDWQFLPRHYFAENFQRCDYRKQHPANTIHCIR